MPKISEVFIVNSKNIIEKRDTKWYICISIGPSKFFIINSERFKLYDDYLIKSSNYNFLKHDSYVECSEVHILDEKRLIKKLGNLNYDDMKMILHKIKNSIGLSKGEIKALSIELEEWLNNYQENQLKNKFSNR
ncbi:MAG: type II toxin-antitoxin system PemK/MazF family toxin [Fibromonadales bacterium]|nr:type II toxin-antitoxin system PemK/MazF family toxin [Fibromonadales bacterium]